MREYYVATKEIHKNNPFFKLPGNLTSFVLSNFKVSESDFSEYYGNSRNTFYETYGFFLIKEPMEFPNHIQEYIENNYSHFFLQDKKRYVTKIINCVKVENRSWYNFNSYLLGHNLYVYLCNDENAELIANSLNITEIEVLNNRGNPCQWVLWDNLKSKEENLIKIKEVIRYIYA